jgi:hypothetical protein
MHSETALGGLIARTTTIVEQLFPNVSQPTATIFASYNGASVTVMRDNIVRPIERQLAGTTDPPDDQLDGAARHGNDRRRVLSRFSRRSERARSGPGTAPADHGWTRMAASSQRHAGHQQQKTGSA